MDVADGGYTTERGAYINKNASTMEQSGEALQLAGDGVTSLGIVTGQPLVIGSGEGVGWTGLGLELANDFIDKGFTKKTSINTGIKIDTGFGFLKLGKWGVKATRTVAGKAVFESWAIIVSESIIDGATFTGSKLTDYIIEEKYKN